ncbi:hypothetical protein ACFQPG_03200 [Sphingomonas sp. GCM10030256]|uniref:hypothetical protein n=1 Tax=Sphingomonas sp. GCM10030256 TaxID=3273427 RepID=UPI00360E392C
MALAAAAVPASARVLAASGSWAAVERNSGRSCEALSRSEILARKGREQARATFSFDRSAARRGQLYLVLSRPARPGAKALLSVADQTFLLATRGNHAWSRGPDQEAAIMTAVRRATDMRVRVRDSAGRGFSDRYLLPGAPTAIDAAAAACAPGM